MNNLLFLLTVLIDFSLLLLLYSWLGKKGILAWIVFATVIANLQVTKTVVLFGFTATLGNVAYASIYLATDILSEYHSKKDAKVAILLGFAASLCMILLMEISLAFQPAAEDTIHPAMRALFSQTTRIVLASLAAYLVSQSFDLWCYQLIRKWHPGRGWLWLRNNAATMLSQLIDTGIFVTIAFLGSFSTPTFISILWTTYALKFIIALLDTPFLYLAHRFARHRPPCNNYHTNRKGGNIGS